MIPSPTPDWDILRTSVTLLEKEIADATEVFEAAADVAVAVTSAARIVDVNNEMPRAMTPSQKFILIFIRSHHPILFDQNLSLLFIFVSSVSAGGILYK